MNSRVTKKERGLIKGALRRVFSRSELRRRVVALSIIDYTDDSRPRVRRWSRCSECKRPTPAYLVEVDHLLPVVPLDTPFEDMSLDLVVERLWCEEHNLAIKCKPCHRLKSAAEASERRKHRRKKVA